MNCCLCRETVKEEESFDAFHLVVFYDCGKCPARCCINCYPKVLLYRMQNLHEYVELKYGDLDEL